MMRTIILELRAKLGLSQTELARRIGSWQSRISTIEGDATGSTRLGRAATLVLWRTFRNDLERMGYSLEDLLE